MFYPRYSITSELLNKMAAVSELVGAKTLSNALDTDTELQLENRAKNIYSNCLMDKLDVEFGDIEAVVHKMDQGTDVVLNNANTAYEKYLFLDPYNIEDILDLHRTLMNGIFDDAGMIRDELGGIHNDTTIFHLGTAPSQIRSALDDLMEWVRSSSEHPIITSTIFHYQFENIYPFSVGNGRVGRMWQMLLLYHWKPFFAYCPIESLINERKDMYYQAMAKSYDEQDIAPFIMFMLDVFYDALYDIPEGKSQSVPDIFDDEDDYVDESDEHPGELSIQVEKLMNVLGDKPMTSRQLLDALGLRHRQSFRRLYIQPAIEAGLIEMTVPDKPNSRNQRYRRIK